MTAAPSPIHRDLTVGTDESGAKFVLPLQFSTSAVAVLAQRGRGKSYTASVIAEEFITAGIPTVILDPTGVWWGLRASASGTAAGMSVVIAGGDHADIPLAEDQGRAFATEVAARRFPLVLDLSLLRKNAARRFATDFLEELYLRNRDPMHLIIDEADLFAPQRAFSGVERLLGAVEDVMRRGRVRGLGATLISQRPAAVSKSALSQAETLVLLGMTSKHDIKAIEDWVGVHADPADAATVIKSLPALPVGTCWVWSPSVLHCLTRVKIRARHTFDSSATPTAGEQRIAPTSWATVDLDELRAALSPITAVTDTETITDVDAADTIAELRRQVETLRTQLATPPPPRTVYELPPTAIASLQAAATELTGVADTLTRLGTELAALADHTPNPAPTPANTAPSPPTGHSGPPISPAAPQHQHPSGLTTLPRAQHRILTALAQHHPTPLTKARLALICQYSAKGGGFSNSLSALRTADAITRGEPITITDRGRELLGSWTPLPTGSKLREHWQATLEKAPAAILAALADTPHPQTREQIAVATGYQPSGGGFNNALSRLNTLGLIVKHSDTRTIELANTLK